jgi:hypothetical protein
MFVRVFSILLLAIVLTSCAPGGAKPTPGKSSSREQVSSLLKSRSTSSNASGTSGAATDVHLTVTGQGNQTSKSLSLREGLALFHLTYSGAGDFTATLVDDSGNEIETLADSSGRFAGSTAVGLSDPCDCVVDVQAAGSWSITIDQPAALAGQALPTTLNGTGQTASPAFQVSGGLVRFHQAVGGQTGGRITLRASTGETLDLLGESDSAFDRSRTVELDQGTYLLQVDTDGPWAVDISAVTGP